MDWSTLAPGIGALLIAVAGWIQQYLKGKKTEQTNVRVNDLLDAYESQARDQRAQIQDLKENEERHERMDRERKAEIRALNAKIDSCERHSARIQAEADSLRNEVQILQATNSTLNARMQTLIQELEKLNEVLKDQTIKLRREPAIL